jgi:spoIIIJ-associated protein
MVEKRASTVEDATAAALRELGIDRADAEIEVISEGRRGLFSGRSRAHVRVTARDLQQRGNGEAPVGETAVDEQADAAVVDTPVDERATAVVDTPVDERAVDVGEAGDHDEPTDEIEPPDVSQSDRLAELNEEADLAADFVEGLLDILELPGDIEIEVDESQAFVNVVEVGSGLLIGRRGATLDALQELVRAATQRQIERRSHVRIDIEGYRQRQLEKIKDRCRDGIAQVRETGEPYRLEPMDAYERKVMHDLVARTGGVRSASEGVEPRRRVVVYAEAE